MARILVIDDDEALLVSLGNLLTAIGHTVVTAADGAAGAKLFRAERFDLILTDIIMPNREGIETIIALHREFPNVGVIAMSGGTAHAKVYLELAERLGAHHTLAKPFTPEQLQTVVSEVLRQIEH